MSKINRRSFLRLSGAGLLSAIATVAVTGEAAAAPASRGTPVICVEALHNVNIRQGASIRSRKIGMLYRWHQATVVAISYDMGWWCIRFGRGTAWVSADPRLTTPVAWRR